jgi:glycosyltransferase involved in cell wall biosynthesis
MDIDVVIITRNSERMLGECLKSVYANVQVNRLIIVDGYSTDKTLQIVREFQEKHGNVLVIHDRGTRATARQKGIDNVKTEWFLFVDSDAMVQESREAFRSQRRRGLGNRGLVYNPKSRNS